MKTVQQLAITLKDTKVKHVLLEKAEHTDTTFELNLAHGLADDRKAFLLQFDCEVTHQEGMKLTLQFVAEFEANNEITTDFFKGNFAKINAPAIAYPFLRAYIANFFVSSGYSALMLPTINFQAMASANKD